MDDDSDKVTDRTWDVVNSEDTAKADEQFALYQGVSEYTTYESWETEGNLIMPCRAVLDFGEQIDSSNDVFGNYNITLGARFYEDEESTEFFSLPQQSSQILLEAPNTDLESEYEVTGDAAADDVSDDRVYLEKAKKFLVNDILTDQTYEGKGWMKLEGGYKLYKSGVNKFFYRWSIELPTAVMDTLDGKIFYFWAKYTAVDDTQSDNNGAVACKTVVGTDYLYEA